MTEVGGLGLKGVGFVPGQAVGLVGPRVVALLDADHRSAVVKSLGSVIAAGGDFGACTQVLVDHGLQELPPLAVVQMDTGSVRVLARGSVVVLLRTAASPVDIVVEAPEVTTWVEHVESDVALVQMHTAGDLSQVGAYQVTGGIVPVARLEIDLLQTAGGEFNSDEPDLPAGVSAMDRSADLGPPSPLPPPPPAPHSEDNDARNEDAEDDEEGPEDASVDVGQVELDVDVASDAAVTGPPPGDRSNVTVRYDEALPLAGSTDAGGGGSPGDVGDDQPQSTDGDDDDDDYDHLFGATQFRPISEAGRSQPDEVPGPDAAAGVISAIPAEAATRDPNGPDADVGDHDGLTISIAQLRAAQASPPMSSSGGGSLPSTIAAMVHAVECPARHLNPPSATSCRICGVEIPDQAHVSVPRPVLGTFRFSTGEERKVARPMLLGRSPKAEGQLGGELPELVPLPSPTKELSGTHLEVRIEGWQVLVVDRRSTNGTTVRLPQREPQRLHPGEPFPIVPGTVIDMAEEVQFTYEVAP